jgi:hypothetical protein
MPRYISARYLRLHSKHLQRSMMWFLQIAQLSTTISQAHKATAFHYSASVTAYPKRAVQTHLLNLKTLLAIRATTLSGSLGLAGDLLRRSSRSCRSICHINVRHVVKFWFGAGLKGWFDLVRYWWGMRLQPQSR